MEGLKVVKRVRKYTHEEGPMCHTQTLAEEGFKN